MGCFSSSMRQRASEIRQRARRKSSIWSDNVVSGTHLTAEDWTQVLVVSNLIRSQGIDVDIMSLTFERLFSKYPKIRTIFIDVGIITQTDDSKFDPKLRAHLREVALAINKVLELKTSDPDILEAYLRELRSLHSRIRGFSLDYYETFGHCFEYAFLHLVGSAVSKQQKEAYRKFIIFLYNSMRKEDMSVSVDKDSTHPTGQSRRGRSERRRTDRSPPMETKESVQKSSSKQSNSSGAANHPARHGHQPYNSISVNRINVQPQLVGCHHAMSSTDLLSEEEERSSYHSCLFVCSNES